MEIEVTQQRHQNSATSGFKYWQTVHSFVRLAKHRSTPNKDGTKGNSVLCWKSKPMAVYFELPDMSTGWRCGGADPTDSAAGAAELSHRPGWKFQPCGHFPHPFFHVSDNEARRPSSVSVSMAPRSSVDASRAGGGSLRPFDVVFVFFCAEIVSQSTQTSPNSHVFGSRGSFGFLKVAPPSVLIENLARNFIYCNRTNKNAFICNVIQIWVFVRRIRSFLFLPIFPNEQKAIRVQSGTVNAKPNANFVCKFHRRVSKNLRTPKKKTLFDCLSK